MVNKGKCQCSGLSRYFEMYKERGEVAPILVLDGAMGTMIQTYNLREEDFRGERFREIPGQMKGNNDILVLTRPDVIKDIHRRYLEAGADIITANTFSSQRISMVDYHCEGLVNELNREAVRIAREAVEEYLQSHPRIEGQTGPFVIATVGPSNKTLSISPDVSNPAYRAVTYDEMYDAFVEQMQALFDTDIDAILLETTFDTLNCKAIIHAYQSVHETTGRDIPLMLSITVNDKMGRLLSGQTLEAVLASVQHAPLLSIGLNCSFGARDMIPCLRILSEKAPYYISAHPNAGLPNSLGFYDQTPEMMQEQMRQFLEESLVNIIGGCCGTTPEHIRVLRQLRDECASLSAHVPVQAPCRTLLSGLELLEVGDSFINVGERCNVAGSRKFLRLIKEGNYDEALSIARKQVEDGAMVIDVNMDDGLLDAQKEMTHFLLLLASDPDICRVPVMIDSSNWEVIRQGLKCLQGKCIVNSISLKEGEEVFLAHAREIKMLGAAVVVMAFDEKGQADTYQRRIEICERAYRLLVNNVGMNPLDIIFDPNILSIATGISAHNSNALDFINATSWIKEHLPGAHVSGGVSNLSFSFRGNNYFREAMHAVFLYHACHAGMDFGIVNPSAKVTYADIPTDLLNCIEEALLRPSDQATEDLISMAAAISNVEQSSLTVDTKDEELSIEESLIRDLQRGLTDRLEVDLQRALNKYTKAVDIIEGPLMAGMNRVGQLFGEGKMFLPQVVKTARTMKSAVSILQPYIDAQRDQNATSQGRVLLATVKGDVHDIGKNIVGIVMACDGYDIIDLGVMVSAEEILKQTLLQKPDIIGLSGLITPSLTEMIHTVNLLRENNIRIPIMIGGATTSEVHTALKIAVAYDGPVVWVKDASQNAPISSSLLNPERSSEVLRQLNENQSKIRNAYNHKDQMISLDEAQDKKPNLW